ncbi:MAG: ribonuclease HII [Anaerolineae bacterium]|nr:ribonuclease HII [Anaerolineae bacterium]
MNIVAEAPTLCGLDEAGRGPLAGPLVAALVAFPVDFDFSTVFPHNLLRDSKKLNKLQRENLISVIHEHALAVETEIITVNEINRRDIGWANRAAFERLIMRVTALEYIVDGNLKLRNLGKRAKRVQCVVRADETVQAVAAASIIAKVTRDRVMQSLHNAYPQYGWNRNMGYGTRAHVLALQEYGITPYHRKQFATTALSHLTPRLPGFEQPEG